MSIIDGWWKSLKDPESIRPWGQYDIIYEDKNCKVKKIKVNPKSRLSYQSHNKREEQWTVIKGTLAVILEEVEIILEQGDSLHIPLKAKHRAWNKTNNKVEFIEVQTGTYFGEDDITRYEDDYER